MYNISPSAMKEYLERELLMTKHAPLLEVINGQWFIDRLMDKEYLITWLEKGFVFMNPPLYPNKHCLTHMDRTMNSPRSGPL